jgi:hypothetical protein
MSNLVYIGGRKGGSGKTTTAHLLCLGAILRGQPAAYVLTDPHRELKPEGRPYGVMDGRDPKALAQIIASSHNAHNGWLVIDGGGNRPEFDKAMAAEADLCLLPFKNSDEDTDSTRLDLNALSLALAWPTSWPTNIFAEKEARERLEALTADYPDRVIQSPVDFVNSSNELLGRSLDNPSTRVRSAARRAFSIMIDCFEQAKAARASNVTPIWGRAGA